jgi:hypothetical protein
MKTAFDGIEGQRPRLTHFSATGSAEIAFRQHWHPNHSISSLCMPQINDFAVHDFANPPRRRRCAPEAWDDTAVIPPFGTKESARRARRGSLQWRAGLFKTLPPASSWLGVG